MGEGGALEVEMVTVKLVDGVNDEAVGPPDVFLVVSTVVVGIGDEEDD